MSKHGNKSIASIPDSEVFHGFVYDGKAYSSERIEQAVRAMRRQLGSDELNRVNDSLLSQLDRAKKNRRKLSKREMLHDPCIQALVNALTLVNQAWIATVIFNNFQARRHLRGFIVEELYSTALTGGSTVGGVMNAILQYDYKSCA